MKAFILISITALLATASACKKKEESATSGSPPAAAKTAGGGDKASAQQPASYGIPDCDAYVAAMEKFLACDKLPAEQKEGYAKQFAKDREIFLEASKGDAASKTTQGDLCKQALSGLDEGAKFRGCAI
jgi:hypothetical protein